MSTLVVCLSDDDDQVRAAAANALNELAQTHHLRFAPSADGVVTSLITAFEKERKYSPKAAMARALGSLGDSRAIAPLYRRAAEADIAASLAAGRAIAAFLSSLGATQDQMSAWARQPIDSWLAMARALTTLGEDCERVIERLTPALNGSDVLTNFKVPYEMKMSLLAEIRSQAAARPTRSSQASGRSPSCERCVKQLELEPLDPSDTLQARLPRTYLAAVCDACSRVECYRCRGAVVAPCSWCKGHCSPAYVTKFAVD